MYILTFGSCKEEYRKISSVEARVKELTGYPVKVDLKPGAEINILGVTVTKSH